jgi:mono/diheme cytochrome c family protein
MSPKHRWFLALCLLGTAGVLVAGFNRPYAWWPLNDMAEQVSFQPFDANGLRTPPEGSVALEQYDPVPDRMVLDAMGLKNPIESSEASIKTGQELYAIYCVNCHGKDMSSAPEHMTPVQLKGMMGLPASVVNMRSDGYIFGTLSNGSGGLMPRMDYNLSPDERWHLVNYIRSLAPTAGQSIQGE